MRIAFQYIQDKSTAVKPSPSPKTKTSIWRCIGCSECVNMRRMDLPIACTLTGPELIERRRIVLSFVRKARAQTFRLPTGYAYEFPMDSRMLEQLTSLVALERQCCPFLTFNVVQTAAVIRLEVTGSPEAVGVIEGFFGGLETE
jgi:hypothetical protein